MSDKEHEEKSTGAHVGEEAPAPLSSPALSHTSVGAELRAAREKKKLSLENIAEVTKIRPGILENIEKDAHDELPALTYTLGFIKAYARTVGLSPQEVAERYRAESHKVDPTPTLIATTPIEDARIPSRRIVVMAAFAVILVLVLAWGWGAGWFTPPPPEPAAPVPVEKAVEEPAPVPAPTPAADSPVTLKALNEVWLEVSAGKTRFFSGTLKAGETLKLPAGQQWTLSTGRAGALTAIVGDKELPPFGGPAEHVRGKLLTAAALLGLPATEAPATAAAPVAAGAPPEEAPQLTGLEPTHIIKGANPASTAP